MNGYQKGFYYLRHHRTSFHDSELICGGGSDAPLNESSVLDLRKYAPIIADHVRDIDIIYTTPLIRARQTANIINEQLNKEIQCISSLAEWHLGEWEGKHWSDFPHPFTYEKTPPGGEPRNVFRKRVIDCIHHLFGKERKFLIVGHGIVFHELSSFLLGEPIYLETAQLASIESVNNHWLYQPLPYKSLS